jgi:hypothetical protein
MNEIIIITIYVVIAEVMEELGHQSHQLSQVSDAEVLLIGVVAALYY